MCLSVHMHMYSIHPWQQASLPPELHHCFQNGESFVNTISDLKVS